MTNITNTTSEPTAPPDRRVSPWWRAAAYLLVIVLSIGVTFTFSMYEVFKAQITHLQGKLQTLPQIQFVAVLTDDQSAPAMLITLDPQEKALQIQRLNAVTEGREDTMQLWALGASGKPESLGVLEGKGKTPRLPTSSKLLQGVTQLAISVEDKGGVPDSKGPRLPYLFKGPLVQKAL
jgi:anti-sigma-K factor RskA